MILKLIEYEDAIRLPDSIDLKTINRIKYLSYQWRKKLKLKKEPFIINGTPYSGYSIRAIGVAGYVRIEGLTIEIAPKFINQSTFGIGWQPAMWRFFMYGRKIEFLGETSGEIGIKDGLMDFLAKLYLSSLHNANIRGYPLGYKEARYKSEFVKGRLDPRHYHELIPFTGKVGIINSQLSRDIPINRLLKWAGLRLAQVVESKKLRKRLIAWTNDLQEVSSQLPKTDRITSIEREHPHLVHSIEIAKILIEGHKAGFGTGKLSLPGFLWDSNELFERATIRLFAEACYPLGLIVSKRTYVLATSEIENMQTTPDITICQNNQKPVLIGDAKYKVKAANPSNEDFYQIMAAGRVRDVNTVFLAYPTQNTGIFKRTYWLPGNGSPKAVITLSIGLKSFSSKAEINILTQKVREWTELTISL